MTARPLYLRRVKPDEAWLAAQNMGWRWQPDTSSASCEVSLCVAPPATPHDIDVITDYGLLRLHTPDAFCLFFSGIDPTQASHPAQRQAFWQAALTRWPVDLLSLLGHPVLSVPSSTPPAHFPYTASLQYRVQDHQVGVRLSGEAATLRRLLTQSGWHPATATCTPDDNLPFSFPIRVSELELDRGLYGTLARGDVLRLPQAHFKPDGEGIFITPLHGWTLRWDSDSHNFILQDFLPKESFPMSLTTDTDSAIHTLPVRLTICLGNLTLSLAEWRNLTPGAILPLAQPCPPRVQIQANGVPVGTGELVELAGSLAVQLTEWPQTEQAE